MSPDHSNPQEDPPEPEETMEQAIELLAMYMKRQGKEPLNLFPNTRSEMDRLVVRLREARTLDEVPGVISQLENFLRRSNARHEALQAFVIPAWKNLDRLIEQAHLEIGSTNFDHYPAEVQMEISALALVWEDLFRAFPFEMSYAYLAVGRNVRPLKAEYFRKFVRLVSKQLGRSIDDIVNEQIPSLE